MTNAEKFKTAEGRARAFTKWCEKKQKTAIGKVAKHECSDCPLDKHAPCCFFFWLDIEAEEEKPLPCPYCGGETEMVGTGAYQMVCMECMYASAMRADRDLCIADHNRVARAVMEAGKDGSNECE